MSRQHSVLLGTITDLYMSCSGELVRGDHPHNFWATGTKGSNSSVYCQIRTTGYSRKSLTKNTNFSVGIFFPFASLLFFSFKAQRFRDDFFSREWWCFSYLFCAAGRIGSFLVFSHLLFGLGIPETHIPGVFTFTCQMRYIFIAANLQSL